MARFFFCGVLNEYISGSVIYAYKTFYMLHVKYLTYKTYKMYNMLFFLNSLLKFKNTSLKSDIKLGF